MAEPWGVEARRRVPATEAAAFGAQVPGFGSAGACSHPDPAAALEGGNLAAYGQAAAAAAPHVWRVGDQVEALYPPDGNYYEARIAAVGPHTYRVDWAEPDEESGQWVERPRAEVRKFVPPVEEPPPPVQTFETCYAADDETPKRIAMRLGVDLQALLQLNADAYEGLTATAKLMGGTVLLVPPRVDGQPAAAAAAAAHPSQFVKTESIHKLLQVRTSDSGGTEYLVKLRGKAYIHVEWMSTSRFDMDDPQMKFKLKRFSQKRTDDDQLEEEEAFLQAAKEIERVVSARGEQHRREYLIKWVGVEYEGCTWERVTDPVFAKALADAPKELADFERWSVPPRQPDAAVPERARGASATALQDVTVTFKDANELRPYQLEGCRWLLHCWQQGHGSILADEMGLGKTVQSVTFLESLRSMWGRRGPFLIVAPLSTIPHWQREFQGWTDMNTLVYHGTAEDRAVIRRHEFRFSFGRPDPHLYKFQVLITTYETILTDFSHLSPVSWACLVVDEAHRMKNRECELAKFLRKLRVEHSVLLTGTPLQNNTLELWSLLNFVDP